MKTFIEFCGETKKELPVYQVETIKCDGKSEFQITEKQIRTGIAHWAYPDGYIRGEYPGLYFTPHMADAIQKMGPKVDDDKVDSGKFTWKNFLNTKS